MQPDLFVCSLQASEEDQVLLWCRLSSLMVLEKSHAAIQECFSELCRSAIAAICQVRGEHRLPCCRFCFIPSSSSYGQVGRSDHSWLFCVCREGMRQT